MTRLLCQALIALFVAIPTSIHAQVRPLGAAPIPARERWRAIDQVAHGAHPEPAIPMIRAMIRDFPEDPATEDALAAGAELAQGKLRDPVLALELWRETLRRFPRGRSAIRARAQEAMLASHIADGPGPLARFLDLQQRFPRRSKDESLFLLQRFVADEGTSSLAPQALLWIGELFQHDLKLPDSVRLPLSERAYARASRLAPQSRFSQLAVRCLGDVLNEEGRIDDARALYTQAASLSDRDAREGGIQGLERVAVKVRRRRWAALALTILAISVLTLALLAFAGRAPRRFAPPWEAKFLAPCLLLMLALASAKERPLLLAVAEVGAGSILLAWLLGLALRRDPSPLTRRPALGFALAPLLLCSVAALIFLAIHQNGLVEIVWETFMVAAEH